MLPWSLAFAASASSALVRFDVVVIDGDAETLEVLERSAACRPAALHGEDALSLAVAAVAGPSAVVVAQPSLVGELGAPAGFRMMTDGPDAEPALELLIGAETFASGALQLSIEVGGGGTHIERQFATASGDLSVMVVGERFVAVRASLVQVVPGGVAAPRVDRTMELIGDGPARARARNLERVLASCGA